MLFIKFLIKWTGKVESLAQIQPKTNKSNCLVIWLKLNVSPMISRAGPRKSLSLSLAAFFISSSSQGASPFPYTDGGKQILRWLLVYREWGMWNWVDSHQLTKQRGTGHGKTRNTVSCPWALSSDWPTKPLPPGSGIAPQGHFWLCLPPLCPSHCILLQGQKLNMETEVSRPMPSAMLLTGSECTPQGRGSYAGSWAFAGRREWFGTFKSWELGQGQEVRGTLEGINANSWDELASTRVHYYWKTSKQAKNPNPPSVASYLTIRWFLTLAHYIFLPGYHHHIVTQSSGSSPETEHIGPTNSLWPLFSKSMG